MALPKLSYPTYEVKLLSQKDPIRIRPFTVREEKLMLMASEAGDLKTTVDTLKQIITNCAVTPLDVDNISMVDLETIFLNLRARSIGEKGKTYFKCQNTIVTMTGSVGLESKSTCGMIIDVDVDFLHVPIVNADQELKIMFDDEIGVKMRYPSFSLFSKMVGVKDEDIEYMLAANCLDLIFDKENVHKADDATQEELLEFLLNLPGDKYEKIREFTQNTPKTRMEVDKTCVKCGFQHHLVLEGIEDFFV